MASAVASDLNSNSNSNSNPMPAPSLLPALLMACAIAVVNGFGRFAYAMLLPVMRDDLAWDYALSGWLNTANSIGYGVGALAGLWLLAQCQPAVLFVAGLATTVLTLLLCGFTKDLYTMMVWRFLTGVGSAWVFACGGALVATLYANDAAKSGAAIAIYYAGGGLGIVASGLLLYPVLSGQWAWTIGWMVLALAGLVLCVWPAKVAWGVGGQTSELIQQPLQLRPLWAMLGAYFLFGVGYIVYLTFVIAWLREMQLGHLAATGIWLVLGLAAIASGWAWTGPMARWRPTQTFGAATLCTAVGSMLPLILPLMSAQWPLLVLSAALVGVSFFMVPAAMMALAKAHLPQPQWAKAMNLFTFIFAIGQAIGPVLAGWIADSQGLPTAMLAAGLTLLLAAGIALAQGKQNQTVPLPPA